MLSQLQPAFLYPRYQLYPFDAVAAQIVHALEARNWQVPGVRVEFDSYGSGWEKYTLVRELSGEDFLLRFGRIQAHLSDNWNDTAAVSELIIPGKQLDVYEDYSGPTLYVYVGRNWKRDRDDFLHSLKVNAKLYHMPRQFLQYTGSIYHDQHVTIDNRLMPYLTSDSDLGRQYEPRGREPRFYRTDDVLAEFTRWFTNNVLGYILSFPETEATQVAKPLLTPYPAERVGALFTYGDENDAYRITQGQHDISRLSKADRYGMPGGGTVFVPDDVPNDGKIPEVAYESFLWAAQGDVTSETPIDNLPAEIGPYAHFHRRRTYVIRITPAYADGIYVADLAPSERYQRVWDATHKGEPFNKGAYLDYMRIRGHTLVPVASYHGDFKHPVVLIRRELDLSEVEVVISPED